MAEQTSEIRKIHWLDVIPALRLTSTFWRAFAFGPLFAGFVAVFLTYAIGRILDPIWVRMGSGVAVSRDAGDTRETVRPHDEVQAFEMLSYADFEAWKIANGRHISGENMSEPDATTIAAQLELIRARVTKGVERIKSDSQLSNDEQLRRSNELRRAADVLRFQLLGVDRNPYPSINSVAAAEKVLAADADITLRQRTDESRQLADLLELSRAALARQKLANSGPFASLLAYEMHCVTAGVHGAVHGRWGLQAGAFDREPALLGSAVSASKGIAWLVSDRPLYACVFGLLTLLLTAPFAGVICRLAAISTAREEIGEFGRAFAFVRERFAALVSAPLMCVGAILVVAFLLAISGVIGGIPKVGPILAGVTFFLALLGGVALAFAGVLLACGFPLMWPTIAVEGSDAFDALQRGGSYTFQRPGLTALYFTVLLLIGSLALLAVRCILMFSLKATHSAIGLGMSAFGTSDKTDTIGRLDAMWWMPAWQDLSLVPMPGHTPFWGIVFYAPLSTSEMIGAYLCAFWVFLFVGLLGAFFIAYLWTGMTDIYFLLRSSVDGVDHTEIYFETEPDIYTAAAIENAEAAATTTAPRPGIALPVMAPPGGQH